MEARTQNTRSDDASSTAQQVGEQAREKTQELGGQASEQAQRLSSQANTKLREQIDQRSTEAGERVSSTASDIRAVGEQLQSQGKETPARFANQAAERAERMSSYLKEADSDRILGDVEEFGRRQPWAVLGGAVLAGFAAARFLKASSRERYERQFGQRETRQPQFSPGTAPALPSQSSVDRTEAGVA